MEIILSSVRVSGHLTGWAQSLVTFLYLGPETIMPLASILATVIGVILVFWRFIVGFIKRVVRKVLRKPAEEDTELDEAAGVETSGEDTQV